MNQQQILKNTRDSYDSMLSAARLVTSVGPDLIGTASKLVDWLSDYYDANGPWMEIFYFSHQSRGLDSPDAKSDFARFREVIQDSFPQGLCFACAGNTFDIQFNEQDYGWDWIVNGTMVYDERTTVHNTWVAIDTQVADLFFSFLSSMAGAIDMSTITQTVLTLGSTNSLNKETLRDVFGAALISDNKSVEDAVLQIIAACPSGDGGPIEAMNLIQGLYSGWESSNVEDTGSYTYSFTTPPTVDTSPIIGGAGLVSIIGSVISVIASVIHPIVGMVAYGASQLITTLIGAAEVESRDYPLSNSQDYIRSFSAPICQVVIPAGRFAASSAWEVTGEAETSVTGAVVFSAGPITFVVFRTTSNGDLAYGVEGFLTDSLVGLAGGVDDYPNLAINASGGGIVAGAKFNPFSSAQARNHWLISGYGQFMAQNAYEPDTDLIASTSSEVSDGEVIAMRGIRTASALLSCWIADHHAEALNNTYDLTRIPKWWNAKKIKDDGLAALLGYLGADYLFTGPYGAPALALTPTLIDWKGPRHAWVGLTNCLTQAYRTYFSQYDTNHSVLLELLAISYSFARTSNDPQYAAFAVMDSLFNATTVPPLSKYSAISKTVITGTIAAVAIAGTLAAKCAVKKQLRKYQAKKNAELVAHRNQYNADPNADNLRALTKVERRAAYASSLLGATSMPLPGVTSASGVEVSTDTLFRLISGDTPN